MAWLLGHGVTGWELPYDALEDAGVDLLHAQHVKQIKGWKTDVADSMWLARICQFGLAAPSLVLPREFRHHRTAPAPIGALRDTSPSLPRVLLFRV